MASATPAWEPQPAPPTASPAALEFAVLEACLASRSARQLPLHEMESQQQSKGREVQRLLLQAHLEQRSTGEGERPCASETSSERCGIPVVDSARASSKPSLDRCRWSAWAIRAWAHPASIPGIKLWLCPLAPSPTSCRGAWSRRRSRTPSTRRSRPWPSSPAFRFPNAAWRNSCPMRPRILTPSIGNVPPNGDRLDPGGGDR